MSSKNTELQFVLVRRDSQKKVEVLRKSEFDTTGYSFLQIFNKMEEWVETEKLEHYKSLYEID